MEERIRNITTLQELIEVLYDAGPRCYKLVSTLYEKHEALFFEGWIREDGKVSITSDYPVPSNWQWVENDELGKGIYDDEDGNRWYPHYSYIHLPSIRNIT